MLRDRRFAKSVFALVVAAAVALIVSGCAFVKPNSLATSQPQGIGSVRVHFNLCTIGNEDPNSICGPNAEGGGTYQYLLGFAVPSGSTPPQTFTATPVQGGAPIVFTLNEEVEPQLAASSAAIQKLISEDSSPGAIEEIEELKKVIGGPWPPSGLQGVGYLSAPITEALGNNAEWSIDADFGLPAPSGGTPYAGPFGSAIAFGVREVGGASGPASRPVRCVAFEEGLTPEAIETQALCTGALQEKSLGTANLGISAPKTTQAFVGGTAKVGFPMQYAGTAAVVPPFTLTGTTTAKGAKVAGGSFTPGTPDPSTHLAPAATGTAKVTLPKNVKPGTYQVTLTATTPQGGSVAQTAKLKVTKPTLKFGAAKLNASKGTATIKVKVPGAGKLTIAGKGVHKVKKKTKKAGTVKVKIAAIGAAAAQLKSAGKAKLGLKATFKPSSGISVSKSKGITLKLK